MFDIKALTHTLTIAALEADALSLKAKAQFSADAALSNNNHEYLDLARKANWVDDEAVEEMETVADYYDTLASYSSDIFELWNDTAQLLTELNGKLALIESMTEHYEKIKKERA